VRVTLQLSAAQSGASSISGRVVYPDGTPAAGVRVSAIAEPQEKELGSNVYAALSLSETDAGGRYRLENVPAGRYLVVATGKIDLPTYYPGVSDVARASVVTVQKNAPIDGIDFSMASGAQVLTASNPNACWRVAGGNGGLLNLQVDGAKLSGFMDLTEGVSRIFDASIDGATIQFKATHPVQPLTASFEGTIVGEKIWFTRSCRPCIGPPNGILGVNGPSEFVAVRARCASPVVPVNLPCDTISLEFWLIGGGAAPLPFNPNERSGIRVTFSKTGEAEFYRNGEYRLFGVTGSGANFTGTLSPTDFQRLCQLARQPAFAAMAGRQYRGVSDGVGFALRITSGTTTQEIVSANARNVMPGEAETLRKAIEAIAGTIQWKPK
jgi:hypothetical protein